MIKMKYLVIAFFTSIFCWSCFSESDIKPEVSQDIQGLKPIYASNDDWKTITTLDIQPIKKLGKIYYKDNLIYVNERTFRVSTSAVILDYNDERIPLDSLRTPCKAKINYRLFGENRYPMVEKIQVQ